MAVKRVGYKTQTERLDTRLNKGSYQHRAIRGESASADAEEVLEQTKIERTGGAKYSFSNVPLLDQDTPQEPRLKGHCSEDSEMRLVSPHKLETAQMMDYKKNKNKSKKGGMNEARKKANKQPVPGPKLPENMAWNIPYGEELTLCRYATAHEYNQYVVSGNYSRVEHKGSINNAVWFMTNGGNYTADFASGREWKVTIYVVINQATPLIHAEHEDFDGEAQHPNQVIVKNNEPGAYGIGREIIKKFKCEWEKNK